MGGLSRVFPTENTASVTHFRGVRGVIELCEVFYFGDEVLVLNFACLVNAFWRKLWLKVVTSVRLARSKWLIPVVQMDTKARWLENSIRNTFNLEL